MTASRSSLIQHTYAPAVATLDLSGAGTDTLMAFSQGQRSRYLNSPPFPHIIIDNLFPSELLEALGQDVSSQSPGMRQFLRDLCSAKFCRFLERLTGAEGLIPNVSTLDCAEESGERDGAISNQHSGLHARSAGDFLKLGVGDNWHPKFQLNRRLRLITYLNTHWQEPWGGHLELWDSQMQNQFVKVPPVFNKTVIFETSDRAYYGYPTPLACPDDVVLRSLSVNYYTAERAAADYTRDAFLAQRSIPPRSGDSFNRPEVIAGRGATGRGPKGVRRKTGPQIPVPVKSVKKTIEKSIPKPLVKLYKAGKRSLRG